MKEDGFVHENIEYLFDLHPVSRFIEIIRKIFFRVAVKKKKRLNLKD
jgi:hypothetical protein